MEEENFNVTLESWCIHFGNDVALCGSGSDERFLDEGWFSDGVFAFIVWVKGGSWEDGRDELSEVVIGVLTGRDGESAGGDVEELVVEIWIDFWLWYLDEAWVGDAKLSESINSEISSSVNLLMLCLARILSWCREYFFMSYCVDCREYWPDFSWRSLYCNFSAKFSFCDKCGKS